MLNLDGSIKEPRYYQRIAIHRAAQAALSGRDRILITMATGAGKTFVALQNRADAGVASPGSPGAATPTCIGAGFSEFGWSHQLSFRREWPLHERLRNRSDRRR